ncbi:MAG: hypothetical protein WC563_15400 [Brevundimonas sp.]
MLPVISDPQADYGLPKNNRDARGPVQPDKEIDAADLERAMVDLAAMSHTCPRATFLLIVSGGAALVGNYRSVWGDTLAVTPAVAYTGAGNVTVTWAVGGYPDLNPTPARQVTRAPSFQGAQVSIFNAGHWEAPVFSVNANSIQTWTYAAGGVATDAVLYITMY